MTASYDLARLGCADGKRDVRPIRILEWDVRIAPWGVWYGKQGNRICQHRTGEMRIRDLRRRNVWGNILLI